MLESLLLAAALGNANSTVLLEFTSPGCHACRAVEPTVRRLQQAGYPVRQVDFNRQPELARQHQVEAIPSFVLVAEGRVVDRLTGPASYDRLVQMFDRAPRAVRPAAAPRTSPPQNGRQVRAQSPAAPERLQLASENPARPRRPQGHALRATVRITVADRDARSRGTGTIIDSRGAESLVMTCGHIFRDSQGKGEISVEVFSDNGPQKVPGTLLMFEADKYDVALLSIRPPVAIEPVPVAPRGFGLNVADVVFSIGCDHGADPSIRESRITSIDKYLGAPNIEVAGQPVSGRSGGGLFASNGALIGVCNAADPEDNEGIYVALPLLQWQLDQLGFQHVYDRRAAPEMLASHAPQPDRLQPIPPRQPAAIRGTIPVTPAGNLAVTPAVNRGVTSGDVSAMNSAGTSAATDKEVICIIRSKRNPHGPSQVITLRDPSQQFLQRLDAESRGSPANPTGQAASREDAQPWQASPVIRAQSEPPQPFWRRSE